MKFKFNTLIPWSFYIIIIIISLLLILPTLDHMFKVSAWVIKEDVSAGQMITSELLVKTKTSSVNVYGSVQSPDAIIGKMLVVSKKASSTIYWNELVEELNHLQ